MRSLHCAFALLAAIGSAAAAHPIDSAFRQPDLTREQARSRADELFDRFDLNHDGLVTRDEAERLGRKLMLQRASTGRDPAHGLGGHTLRFLEHRFRGAEAVSKPEFEDALLAHFDEMDSNHDGILTAAEREEAR